MPLAGGTAWQGLDRAGELHGRHVVVVGAGGGVGSFAVQIAKSRGAVVTGVCSAGSVDFVRGLGADDVIDYTDRPYIDVVKDVDVVFDAAMSHSPKANAAVLAEGGIHLAIGAPAGWESGAGRWIEPIPGLLRVLTAPRRGSRRSVMVTARANRGLADLVELVADGRVRPAVQRTYPLAEAADAVGYLATGHARGKVVITV